MSSRRPEPVSESDTIAPTALRFELKQNTEKEETGCIDCHKSNHLVPFAITGTGVDGMCSAGGSLNLLLKSRPLHDAIQRCSSSS